MTFNGAPIDLTFEGGRFDEYVYTLIIEAALDGWTPESYIINSGRSSTTTSKCSAILRFLARCCLVNREWLSIAQRLLYRAIVHGE